MSLRNEEEDVIPCGTRVAILMLQQDDNEDEEEDRGLIVHGTGMGAAVASRWSPKSRTQQQGAPLPFIALRSSRTEAEDALRQS